MQGEGVEEKIYTHVTCYSFIQKDRRKILKEREWGEGTVRNFFKKAVALGRSTPFKKRDLRNVRKKRPRIFFWHHSKKYKINIYLQVWIRSARWIRGWCTGFIAAFDKQWNLALTDVDETFTRKRRRKTPVYGISYWWRNDPSLFRSFEGLENIYIYILATLVSR